MASGWYAFLVVAAILFFAGLVLAIALLRAAWAQKEREALTSSDLRALEESALMLIEQLKSDVDDGISAVEARSAELRELICAADARLAALRETLAESPDSPEPTSPGLDSLCILDERRNEILDMAAKGADCAEIARASGMDCAEVKLMLRMAKIPV